MDRVIEVKINGNHLSKDNNLAGVQGEANATYLRIEFDEGWDGHAKTLLWLDARGEKTTGRILSADLLEDITESTRTYLAPIPGEALAEWGEILFAVDGYINGKRQKSAYGKLNVKPGDEFAVLEDVTPSQAEQLQAQIDILLGDMGEQATIAHDAAATATRKAAEAAESEANAEAAQNAAVAARDRAVAAETAAKAAQKVAEEARDVAVEVVSGDFASNTQARGYANAAESNAKKYTDDKIAGLGVTNPNLLDNWYFANPVNQRGKTEYTAEGHTIDRWKKNPNGKLIITSEGVTLSAVDAGANTIVDSLMEYDLIGKQITVSALTADGQLFANTDIPAATTTATVFAYLDIGGKGLAGLVVSGAEQFMRIRANPGNSISIVAVKLELGTQQTLARKDAAGKWVLNEIPNYHEQLLRCSMSKADKNDTYANKVIIHTGNMAQYLGVAQASLEE